MVYAKGHGKTFVSKKPLKTKRVQSEAAREVDTFMKEHRISVQTDSSGRVIVKAIKG